MTRHIVVVGGGISGLATAFEIERCGGTVTLLEAASTLGGKLQTSPVDGIMVNEGADAFLARVPDAIELCHEVGLGDELVEPAQRSAYLYVNGSLRRIPQPMILGVPLSVGPLVASGVVTADEARAVAADLNRTDPAPDHGDSVGRLIRTRMGDAVADRLVGPLLGGINAGDVDRLSLAAGAPQLAAAAAASPSLSTALIEQRATSGADPGAPIFFTVPGGLRRLIDAVADHLVGEVVVDAPATELLRGVDGSWTVTTPDRSYEADAVVLATPAPVTECLIRPITGATPLADIDYASVAVATMVYDPADISIDLDASGFLVPHSEGLLMTAATWASSKWPHLAGGPVIIRVSSGRYGDDRPSAMTDDELVVALRADLQTTMGITQPPTATRVSRWVDSFPQYTPGHLDRIAAIEAIVAQRCPDVFLTGATYRGIGIPACIRQGRASGRAAVKGR